MIDRSATRDGEAPGATSTATTYDAYVSHAEGDRDWVDDVLAPRLEHAGHRPFLEHDLPPGAVEIEARGRAIAASRKVLVVLSHAFLDSRWSLLEEAMAQSLDPAARKRRIIPILRDDCPSPLHVRPLVAVDLRRGDPRQWQRLLDALDPQREELPPGPVQRLSLRVAEATSDLSYPGWNVAGLLWMGWLYLSALAALILLNVLLWEAPALRNSLTALLAAPLHGLAALAWREDRDIYRRLSHVLAGSRLGRGFAVLATACVVGAWLEAGVPELRRVLCGDFGCKEEGQTYLTIQSFEAVEALPGAIDWALDARHVLEQKLSTVSTVRVVGTEAKQLSRQAIERLRVDYTLFGTVRGRLPFTVDLAVHDGEHQVVGSVQVRSGGGNEGQVGDLERLELHQRLAVAALRKMDIQASPAELDRMEAVPTASPEAWSRAREAWDLQKEGKLEAAQVLLREALAIDPCFAAAWSNSAELSWRLGHYEEALAQRREAVTCLPEFAPFRYNLGHLLAYVGRDEEALVELQAAAKLDPGHGPTYNELGNLWLRLDSPRRAIRALREGRRHEPRFAPLAKNLGRALLAGGDADAAANALEDALRLYPPDDWLGRSEAHAFLALASWRRGQVASACSHLGALDHLDPAGVTPWRAVLASEPIPDCEPDRS